MCYSIECPGDPGPFRPYYGHGWKLRYSRPCMYTAIHPKCIQIYFYFLTLAGMEQNVFSWSMATYRTPEVC
jgi:hypothetical protein